MLPEEWLYAAGRVALKIRTGGSGRAGILNGQTLHLGWKCYCDSYEEKNGIKMPTNIKSTKLFPDGKELVYFASDHFTVEYLK